MKGIGKSQMIYELEFDLHTNFNFQNSHVRTITSLELDNILPSRGTLPKSIYGIEIPQQNEHKSEFGYLLIESTFELEEYDSLTEGAAKIRPQLLVIQGVLSFLTNKIFISFQSFAVHQYMVNNHIVSTGRDSILISEGLKLDSDLNKILCEIECASTQKKSLIYSLFERWRKALYLEIESNESFIHVDESILAYMHILEVLADEFKKNLKTKIAEERKQIIAEILECANVQGGNNYKKLKGLLNKVSELNISLKSKILQMLSDLNLDNPKSREIVQRFIEHRNAIAHGRKDIYQDKVVYPLKPFFSLIKDVDEDPDVIKVLSAKTISNYLGLDVWANEWDCLLFTEPTPLYLVEEFIANQKYAALSNKEFLSGSINGIEPSIVSYYYLKGKITFSDIEQTLKEVLLTSNATKENCQALFNAAVPLSDSLDQALNEKARAIVKKVDEYNWGYYSNIRDVLKDYEYHGLKLKWFKEWLVIR